MPFKSVKERRRPPQGPAAAIKSATTESNMLPTPLDNPPLLRYSNSQALKKRFPSSAAPCRRVRQFAATPACIQRRFTSSPLLRWPPPLRRPAHPTPTDRPRIARGRAQPDPLGPLGAFLRALGALLDALGTPLDASWTNLARSWSASCTVFRPSSANLVYWVRFSQILSKFRLIFD